MVASQSDTWAGMALEFKGAVDEILGRWAGYAEAGAESVAEELTRQAARLMESAHSTDSAVLAKISTARAYARLGLAGVLRFGTPLAATSSTEELASGLGLGKLVRNGVISPMQSLLIEANLEWLSRSDAGDTWRTVFDNE